MTITQELTRGQACIETQADAQKVLYVHGVRGVRDLPGAVGCAGEIIFALLSCTTTSYPLYGRKTCYVLGRSLRMLSRAVLYCGTPGLKNGRSSSQHPKSD